MKVSSVEFTKIIFHFYCNNFPLYIIKIDIYETFYLYETSFNRIYFLNVYENIETVKLLKEFSKRIEIDNTNKLLSRLIIILTHF